MSLFQETRLCLEPTQLRVVMRKLAVFLLCMSATPARESDRDVMIPMLLTKRLADTKDT